MGIYACGPTVYGRVHVGNARPYRRLRAAARFLEHEGYEATLVVNVTDVNDKIYDAARERGVASAELAREMTAAYVEDTDRLGLGRPDSEPKASETIDAIVSLIDDLVESGHAYEARRRRVLQRSRASTATASSRTARSRRCSRARATTPPR